MGQGRSVVVAMVRCIVTNTPDSFFSDISPPTLRSHSKMSTTVDERLMEGWKVSARWLCFENIDTAILNTEHNTFAARNVITPEHARIPENILTA